MCFSRGGKAVRLTIDHKASLPEEAKRITDAGGFIGRNKRVNGVLAISRALGDHMLKENDVVSAEPFCSDTELTPEDTHILLACGQPPTAPLTSHYNCQQAQRSSPQCTHYCSHIPPA